jgi:cysteine desulfurase
MPRKSFYFDYAATCPVDPRVFKAMKPYFSGKFGNPSNLYDLGRRSKDAIDSSSGKIADVLNCRTDELIFTGSATEADNAALLGVARANKKFGNKIIVSNIEHKGILSVCDILANEGFEIVYLFAEKNGLINPRKLSKVLDKNTILVSITYADSETGTVQDIKKLAEIVKKIRTKNGTPYFHTDASQAAVYLDIDVKKLGVDLMTLSAHKIYGPKGIGCLFVKKGIGIQPLIVGGGQQNKLRAGTENVPGIVGFATAIDIADTEKRKECTRIRKLRDELEKNIIKNIKKVVLNGHKTKRLPNFLNISVLDIEGEAAMLYLDEKGIFVSTGSACNSQSLEPSYILTALGRPYEHIHGSIRFSLGRYSGPDCIKYVSENFPDIVERLRRMSPINVNMTSKKEMSQPKAFVGGQKPHFLRKKR